jgi:quercetin dioxygenase-like cupin family protein
MAIRLIRLFTDDDDQSHFSVSEIEWNETQALNAISKSEQAKTISFEETAAGASLDWHNAPHRQYVITLSGRLEFETRTGAKQVVEPGDILLAEDTSGGGHRWRLVDDRPWRRAYIALP